MQEYKVKNFAELHQVLARYRNSNSWLFRGQSSGDWKLVPKAGREPYKNCDDQLYFQSWKRRAVEFINLEPQDDWDWLALSQHYGLATRLLDWTYNPLVAAFFAIHHNADSEAYIFAYCTGSSVDTVSISPFDFTGIGVFKPNGLTQRIIRQGGVFTVHNPPTACKEEKLAADEALEKIIIDASYTRELQFELSHYGVNNFAIFSDLGGLSMHVNWYMENSSYWN